MCSEKQRSSALTILFFKEIVIAFIYLVVMYFFYFIYVYVMNNLDNSGVLYLNIFKYCMSFGVGLVVLLIFFEWLSRKRFSLKFYNGKAMFIAILLFLSTSYLGTLFIVLNIDSSFSNYLVTFVSSYGTNGVTYQELENGFEKWYTGQNYITRRVQEQMTMGLIVENSGKFYITKRGELLAKVNILVGNFFNLSKQNFMHTNSSLTQLPKDQ